MIGRANHLATSHQRGMDRVSITFVFSRWGRIGQAGNGCIEALSSGKETRDTGEKPFLGKQPVGLEPTTSHMRLQCNSPTRHFV